jgi:hypothetical protein
MGETSRGNTVNYCYACGRKNRGWKVNRDVTVPVCAGCDKSACDCTCTHIVRGGQGLVTFESLSDMQFNAAMRVLSAEGQTKAWLTKPEGFAFPEWQYALLYDAIHGTDHTRQKEDSNEHGTSDSKTTT